MATHSKKMGTLSATFIGISSIIGSGWLFSAYKTATLAGPAAIFSWFLAALIVLMIGLCFAEVAALYPKRGLSAVVATMTHNKYFGFPFAISNWLGVVAVISLEAVATIQYFINLFPSLKEHLYSQGQLTLAGVGLSILLALLYALLNFWGVNLLAKTNNILSLVKLIVPIVTGLFILTISFHPHNFTLYQHTIAPYGWGSVVTAIITTGIIVSFNGFQTITYFANEVKTPHKTIPRSIVFAILFSLGVYLLLQVAYIVGMPPSMIENGWSHIAFNAPMVELSATLGLGFLSTIIYFGAFVSPSGAGIALTGAATRMLTAMSDTKQMPRCFSEVNPKIGMSRKSLFANIFIAILFLLILKSWTKVALILTLYHVLSYLSVPIALVVFRNRHTQGKYGFQLPFGKTIAFLCFIIFTYLVTVVQAEIMGDVFLLFILFQAILIILGLKHGESAILGIKKSISIFVFLGLLTLLTYASPQNGSLLPHVIFTPLTLIFATFFFFYFIYQATHQSDADREALAFYLDQK